MILASLSQWFCSCWSWALTEVGPDLGCPSANRADALILLGYVPASLPTKASFPGSNSFISLSSTNFKSAVILTSFQNKSPSRSMNVEGTIQKYFCFCGCNSFASGPQLCSQHSVLNTTSTITVVIVTTIDGKCWPLGEQNNWKIQTMAAIEMSVCWNS